MARNSKEMVRSLLAGKVPDRPPFIPIVSTVAAQFMQVPIEEIFSDPTCLANSLQSCHRLFGYDGVVVLYDQTLEAEACGCEIEWREDAPPILASHIGPDDIEGLDATSVVRKGRLPAVFEAARRLVLTIGKDTAVLGAVTGPVTLARLLSGRPLEESYTSMPELIIKTSAISLQMVRSFCELRVDGILLADDDLTSFAADHCQQIVTALKPIYNSVKFYNSYLIIQSGCLKKESIDSVIGLPADGFSLGDEADLQSVQQVALARGSVFGANLSRDTLLGSKAGEATSRILDRCKGQRFFVSTQGEVPFATQASSIHDVLASCRR